MLCEPPFWLVGFVDIERVEGATRIRRGKRLHLCGDSRVRLDRSRDTVIRGYKHHHPIRLLS